MDRLEIAVASAIIRERRSAEKYKKKTEEARKALGKRCSHPQDHVVEYKWEHDNGYGIQHWMTGLRCTLCLKRCPYPGKYGSWYDSQDLSPEM